MRDPSQITTAIEHKLIVFCWGDHNNDQENIKFLKKVGLHGIIYDKYVRAVVVLIAHSCFVSFCFSVSCLFLFLFVLENIFF